jgi:hypothetical protein
LSSDGNSKKGKMTEWRGNKVQQLLVRGYSLYKGLQGLCIAMSPPDNGSFVFSPEDRNLLIPARFDFRHILILYFFTLDSIRENTLFFLSRRNILLNLVPP